MGFGDIMMLEFKLPWWYKYQTLIEAIINISFGIIVNTVILTIYYNPLNIFC